MMARRGSYRVLVGKQEVRRAVGKASCRWEDNTETVLNEIGSEGLHWIDLAQDRDRWQIKFRFHKMQGVS
jgi:hypothetical protein